MRPHIDSELDQLPVPRDAPEWTARPERSNRYVIRLIVWIALKLGRPIARALLYPIVAYFLAFAPSARRASADFLRRALGRTVRVTDSFRHFHCFAAALLDRVFLLNDQFARFDVSIHGQEIVEEMTARGEGGFLLGAHLGSFEIVRSIARAGRGTQVSLAMYEENAQKVSSVLNAINPLLTLEIIALGNLDAILKVRAAVERGGFVGMLGDRTIEGEGTLPCVFFGERVGFPTGPFRVAALLKRPIVLMFGIYRGGQRYDVYFERLPDMPRDAHAQCGVSIEESLQRYVTRLEDYCRAAPYNWFNFYDFWR